MRRTIFRLWKWTHEPILNNRPFWWLISRRSFFFPVAWYLRNIMLISMHVRVNRSNCLLGRDQCFDDSNVFFFSRAPWNLTGATNETEKVSSRLIHCAFYSFVHFINVATNSKIKPKKHTLQFLSSLAIENRAQQRIELHTHPSIHPIHLQSFVHCSRARLWSGRDRYSANSLVRWTEAQALVSHPSDKTTTKKNQIDNNISPPTPNTVPRQTPTSIRRKKKTHTEFTSKRKNENGTRERERECKGER